MKQFLETCRQACHDCQACAEGLKDLLAAETIEQIAAVWRKYLPEVVGEKFAGHVLHGLDEHYTRIAPEFNRAGIYYNECPRNAPSNTIVIISGGSEPVNVYGSAYAYVLGDKPVKVYAHNTSTVYSTMNDNADIILYDGSVGKVSKGVGIANNHSILYATSGLQHMCSDSSFVLISNGTLYDRGHMVIRASGNAIVNSFTSQKILIFGNAQLQIIP